jgi:hypothetical protein
MDDDWAGSVTGCAAAASGMRTPHPMFCIISALDFPVAPLVASASAASASAEPPVPPSPPAELAYTRSTSLCSREKREGNATAVCGERHSVRCECVCVCVCVVHLSVVYEVLGVLVCRDVCSAVRCGVVRCCGERCLRNRAG